MGGLSNPFESILSQLKKKKRSGKGYVGLCPAHDDKKFSLSVGCGDDGRVLLKCHAGCSIDALCEALGISKAGLFADDGVSKPRNSDWDIVATYDYHNEVGEVTCQHVRYRNKVFSWRTPVGDGNWRYGFFAAWYEQWDDSNWRAVKDKSKNIFDDPSIKPHAKALWFDEFRERKLYRALRLREAEPGALVLYVEGEKDQHTGTRLDFIATTAGSASDWRPDYAKEFEALNLVVIPDNDAAGEKLAAKVAADCYGIAESVRVLRLPDLAEHGDLSDWEAASGTREQLLALIEEAEYWQPEVTHDELIERALKEAQRAIQRATSETRHEDSDPIISEDKNKDRTLRLTARDAARVVDVIMLIMASLGFEGNHYRIINALIAYAKKLPNPLIYFVTTHAQIYQKYRRTKTVKDRSKTALVGADTAKLRSEQDALGYEVINYIPGKMNLDTGQGYGSKYRLQILRYALIAIHLANSVREEFPQRWQADEWAAQQVAEMIPQRQPVAKMESSTRKAEARAKEVSDFESAKAEFLKSATAEFNRIVEREVAKPGTIESLSEKVDGLAAELVNKINRIASEALCQGMATLAEIESEITATASGSYVHENMDIRFEENEQEARQADELYVHDFMDIETSSDSPPVDSDNTYLLRNRNIITFMPDKYRT